MGYTGACKLEHLLMVKLDNYRYKGRQVLVKNGSTELFKQDVSKHIIRALQGWPCNEKSLNWLKTPLEPYTLPEPEMSSA